MWTVNRWTDVVNKCIYILVDGELVDIIYVLGATYGSAQSMDRAARCMDH